MEYGVRTYVNSSRYVSSSLDGGSKGEDYVLNEKSHFFPKRIRRKGNQSVFFLFLL